MINKIKITGLLLLIAVLSGCVKDGLDVCPEGSVKLNLFVEKFRNKSQNPLDDYEDNFNDRVGHLRYYLYRDGKLNREGIIDKFAKASGPSYTFDFQNLEYGSYNMVIVANSTKAALSGDQSVADNLLLTYPGVLDTEDYFTAVFPFEVKSNNVAEYDVGLLRTHGVIRYTFKNMPDDISDIEMVMRNVSSEKWVTGDYKNACEAASRYVIVPLAKQATDDGYVVSTFPSLAGSRSAYYLNVYRNREVEPYLNQLVTDTLTVTRNQLLDIAVTFNKGGLSFEIDLDSEWDGSSSGGETGLE